MHHTPENNKRELEKQVIAGTREFVINVELFRYTLAQKLGIALSDIECLGILYHKKITTPSELAKHTRLSSGATTAMLIRLEKAGLITRSVNPKDHRSVHITLVEEKQKHIRSLFTPINYAEREFMATYSANELGILSRFINDLAVLWEDTRKGL
jgi:DNA-binding MarR family transcriptional regulator